MCAASETLSTNPRGRVGVASPLPKTVPDEFWHTTPQEPGYLGRWQTPAGHRRMLSPIARVRTPAPTQPAAIDTCLLVLLLPANSSSSPPACPAARTRAQCSKPMTLFTHLPAQVRCDSHPPYHPFPFCRQRIGSSLLARGKRPGLCAVRPHGVERGPPVLMTVERYQRPVRRAHRGRFVDIALG
jgi:hypothetical protein